MNLSQLKYVKAVAETSSFSRASEKSFVTQPSLSNAIAQLEEELGDRLFFRTTHSVSLTPFGERMLPLVTAVLDDRLRSRQLPKTWPSRIRNSRV